MLNFLYMKKSVNDTKKNAKLPDNMVKEEEKAKKTEGIIARLAIAGIALFVDGVLLANIKSVSESVSKIFSPNIALGEGLPLLEKGAHLRQGDHNVILTDSFYEALDRSNQFRCDLAIKGVKEAYDVLNEYNKGLNFNLCTTNEDLSKKYFIPMVDKKATDDIFIYGTNDVLLNNEKVLGYAQSGMNFITRELYDLKITFRLNKLYKVWSTYCDSVEKTLALPHNSGLYSCTVHETMHLMGFRHIEENERISIMNPYQKSCNKELTQEDIEFLDRYNVQFYNTKSIFEEDNKDVVVTSSIKEDKEEMSM